MNMTTPEYKRNRQLNPLEQELLNYLVKNQDRYIKDVPIVGMESRETLAVYICRLRAKIGKDQIYTLRGVGYQYVGERALIHA